MTRVALLWDESFLWGLMACKGFSALGIDTDIVTAAEVRAGALDGYDILVVPGGWASDKTVALGPEGREAVVDFVRSGGSYLGICGGAGLALDVEGGLGLTHVTRVPTSHRVPSFSGQIEMVPSDPAHPLWKGLKAPYFFTAWWPGQFHLGEGGGVRVVATYGAPGRDFAIADLPAQDFGSYGDGWEKWENGYGINLNPGRLVGEPAIIEGKSGEGTLFLTYLHLETPGNRQGNRALANLVDYLGKKAKKAKDSHPRHHFRKERGGHPVSPEAVKAAREMARAADALIRFGGRNFLWYWRNSWMLQYRRGVRGVEYSMLHGLTKELSVRLRERPESSDLELSGRLVALRDRALPFFEDAKKLLLLERFALMNGVMSSINSHDPEVTKLRERLFSGSKRFGGEFKALLDGLGEAVLPLLRRGK